MLLWRRPLREFMVQLELNGRHPYLDSNNLDYENGIEDVIVLARDWNDAESKALQVETRQRCWSKTVWRITALPVAQ